MGHGREGSTRRVEPDRIARAVLGTGLLSTVLLVALDLAIVFPHTGRVGPFREIFWLTAEATVGTWFVSSVTLLIGVALAAIAWLARVHSEVGPVWPWGLLAGAFVFLSADDAVQIHESIGTVIEHGGAHAGAWGGLVDAFPSYQWQLAFGLPLLGVLYLLLGFAAPRMELPERRLLIGGVIGLAIAVGLDFLEGLPASHPMNLVERLATAIGADDWTRASFRVDAAVFAGHLFRVAEEALEIAAMTTILAAFCRRWATLSQEDARRGV